MEYKITLTYDNDAGVWLAESEDVPGLVLESGSFDALIERVRFAVPELLELNKTKENNIVRLHFVSDRRDQVAL